MAKRYEELSIEDDFMFGKVMEDKELCRDVLQCLLEEPVEELEEVRTQREFRYTSKGKSRFAWMCIREIKNGFMMLRCRD